MAFDAFIKIGDIEGGSEAKGHKGEIEVLSYSWGLRQEIAHGGGGGAGAGKATAADFSFLMEAGIASPELALAVCRGEQFPEAIFTATEAGAGAGKKAQPAFYKLRFTEVLISSYQVGGQSGGVPTDQVSLNFAKVELEYEDQKGKGKVSFCDFKKQAGG